MAINKYKIDAEIYPNLITTCDGDDLLIAKHSALHNNKTWSFKYVWMFAKYGGSATVNLMQIPRIFVQVSATLFTKLTLKQDKPAKPVGKYFPFPEPGINMTHNSLRLEFTLPSYKLK